ncbi:MAG TPA: polysaccharide deacetylase family protein [Hanamia sp.]|jgi:peptidoglycan/xylan/chitin deacetylase (PgdA/CDA1 family)|nr:polysaccharide deacetylase family protein [Hanamia sp.]
MKSPVIFAAFCIFIFLSCNNATAKKDKDEKTKTAVKVDADKDITQMNRPVADAAAIFAKRQVPVLCYHHIREPKPGQSETMKSYSVSPAQFAQQMKALKDSGYETILPNQLFDYLVHGVALPSKPVMLTFDDTDEEQFSIGYQEMKKYGFKGVFFIMTISINKPRYMTKEQLKQLADDGNAVESHTWDHHMVTKYQGEDWDKQFVKPRKTIEDITGKPATYFAYPYGLWNEAAIPQLKKAGFKMAFILSTKRDSAEPLYTVRRMIVPGQWSATGMIKAMKQTFKLD